VSDADDDVQVGACVPVWLAPELPSIATYSKYESVPCPHCKHQMWLGERMKAKRDKEGIEVLCMLCLVNKHGKKALDADVELLFENTRLS
jgi:hypothetical protein